MIEIHILLLNVPSRSGIGGKFVPLGLLYLGSIIERCGHSCELIDPYNEDPNLVEFDNGNYLSIEKAISKIKPDIIAFGGIASSYGRAKKLSNYFYEKYPEIVQVAGGALASVYKLLLTRTHIHLVFHGEAERSFPKFLDNEALVNIRGISYLSKGEPHRNESAQQIEDLDIIPVPAYHLVNINTYLIDGLFPIMSSRGCTNACSFCYRHMKGYRQHSVEYVIHHMQTMKEIFGITGFLFGDELFNYNKNWVLELCNKIEALNIRYAIAGARVNMIDAEMLVRLKQTRCEYIYYGQESGSPSILREYHKGVSVQKNIEITKLTKSIGIKSIVQLVIGSPSETQDTIDDTIQFLKDCEADEISVNYLLPFPETPIWEYVEKNNLIPDVETYLDEVAERGGSQIINLTKVSDRIWRTWSFQITSEWKLYLMRNHPKYLVMYPLIKIMESAYRTIGYPTIFRRIM